MQNKLRDEILELVKGHPPTVQASALASATASLLASIRVERDSESLQHFIRRVATFFVQLADCPPEGLVEFSASYSSEAGPRVM